MVGLEQKRQAVCLLKAQQLSFRQACRVVGISRSSFSYQKKQVNDALVLEKLRGIVYQHPRFGYRRATALMRRAGLLVNHKRVHRLWQQFSFQVPRQRKKRPRRAIGCGVPPMAHRPNEVWSYDFIFDAAGRDRRRLKTLTIIDEYTRESLCLEAARSMKASRVVEIIAGLIEERGAPDFLRSDNGSEFAATEVRDYLEIKQTKTLFIEPGKPWQNAKCESFNGKFRDECLNQEYFSSLAEARVVIEKWRKFYNTERPHSSLQYQTPEEMKQKFEIKQKSTNLIFALAQ